MLIGSCGFLCGLTENFQGPEDGAVLTFAKTRPNPSPRGLAVGLLRGSLLGKSAPFGQALLVFLLVFLVFAPEIR